MFARIFVVGLSVAASLGISAPAGAQSTESVGARAQGMAGAFVAVADDASAVYWNPAGLARGAYFSLVIDGNTAKSIPDSEPGAGKRSGWLLALSTPALGLSYYRLHTTALRPLGSSVSSAYELETLITHHVGATLVQSLTDGLAVGATVKLVRGLAASAEVPPGEREERLEGWDLLARSGNRVDLDIGVMATGSIGQAGLTIRNVSAPAFKTGGATELRLDRQIRGGASVFLLPNWKLAADLDFIRHAGAFGDVRELSVGTEGQLMPRLAARGGFRLNTTGERGRTPAMALGVSFAAFRSVLLDAHVTAGPDSVFRGWGVAGRVIF
jgi:hypothetical protein